MSPIGRLAVAAGIVQPAPEALRAEAPPPPVFPEEQAALPPADPPATARPFLLALAAALVLYAAVTIPVMRTGRGRRPERSLEEAA